MVMEVWYVVGDGKLVGDCNGMQMSVEIVGQMSVGLEIMRSHGKSGHPFIRKWAQF